jgi:hypothetical protein
MMKLGEIVSAALVMSALQRHYPAAKRRKARQSQLTRRSTKATIGWHIDGLLDMWAIRSENGATPPNKMTICQRS